MNMTKIEKETLFQELVKERFIEDIAIAEETIRSYKRIFKITAPQEYILNKDLNQFSFQELEQILYSFQANNRNTIECYARIISSYLHWSVKNNLASINLLEHLTPGDFEKYLTNEETYFTDKQIRSWEEQCVNYQDALLLRLLFIGVSGKKMSEIRNLKPQDVDRANKTLKVVNSLQENEMGIPEKCTERIIKVDQRTIDLIDKAIQETTYRKRNGQMVQT